MNFKQLTINYIVYKSTKLKIQKQIKRKVIKEEFLKQCIKFIIIKEKNIFYILRNINCTFNSVFVKTIYERNLI